MVKTKENLFLETPIKVVLINPPPKKRIEKHDKPDYPHLGLAYIATFLRSKNVDCNIIDGKFELIDFDGVKARLQLLKPDIVGITAMTHEIHRASEMAQVVKGILPKAMVVVGGPHATALPVETLAEFTAFDLAVFGEGELTMLELAKFVSSGNQKNLLPQIKGVTYRDGYKIQRNEPRELVENLDDLPFPDWGLLPKSVHYPIVTGRGCPFRCIFCMRALGNRVRKRSAKNVVDELKSCIEKYEPKYIHFLDETFSINKQYILEVLNLMTEAGLDKKIKWDAQTRADLVDYNLLRRMKVAGCVWLGFGIESGNSEILKDSGKNITLNQAKEAVNMARKAGINTDGYFILGHPFETQKTAMDTINFACRLGSTRVTFGIMVPYPGTEIYKMAFRGDGGYKIISHDWRDFGKNIGNSLELETLSRRQLEKLQMLGYLKFYIRNLRIGAGIRYFIHQRKLGWAILKKFLGVSFPWTAKNKLSRQLPRGWGEQLVPDRPIPLFILQGSINRYVWANQFTEDEVILDVACGSGYGSNYLKTRAREVIAGDLSREAIHYASSRYKRDKIHFIRLSAHNLPFASSSFDSVISFETIEHLERYENFTVECERILKESGQFICSTPNGGTTSSGTGKRLAHYHVKEFSINEFRSLLEHYFPEVNLYGMDPQSKSNTLLYLLAARLQYIIFSVPNVHRFVNFFTKFFFHRYHLVKLSDYTNDAFERIVDEEYRPYPLESESLVPGDMIALSRKKLNV